jgi:hypothetical protein
LADPGRCDFGRLRLLTICKGSAARLPRVFGPKIVGHKNKSRAQTPCGAGYPPMYLDSGSGKVRFWPTQALRRICKGSAAARLPRFFGPKIVAAKNKSRAQTPCGVGYPPMYLDSGSGKVRFWPTRALLRIHQGSAAAQLHGFSVKKSSPGKTKTLTRILGGKSIHGSNRICDPRQRVVVTLLGAYLSSQIQILLPDPHPDSATRSASCT